MNYEIYFFEDENNSDLGLEGSTVQDIAKELAEFCFEHDVQYTDIIAKAYDNEGVEPDLTRDQIKEIEESAQELLNAMRQESREWASHVQSEQNQFNYYGG